MLWCLILWSCIFLEIVNLLPHTSHFPGTWLVTLWWFIFIKKNLSNSFHTPYTEPWLQMKHFPSSSLLPQGRRALHRTRLKIKTESVIHLLQMVLGLWGIVHDVQIFQLLSSGARYLVLMVVCHKVGRNQNLHCAPHKVESLLNYSEVRIII